MRTFLRDEKSELEITDEGFDSPLTWLKLTVKSENEEGSAEAEIEIPLRDLMGALIGFDAKRNRFEEEIKDYSLNSININQDETKLHNYIQWEKIRATEKTKQK